MNRRKFLAGATSGGLLISAGAGAWRLYDVGLLNPDLGPFDAWRLFEQAAIHDPQSLVAAAILASNPHNTQPWQFRLGEGWLEVIADTSRHLGPFDPYRREMWIGLGAAIGNMKIAAPGLGFLVGDPVIHDLGLDGAGRIRLDYQKTEPKPNALASLITKRRTNRAPYQTTPLNSKELTSLQALTAPDPHVSLQWLDRKSDWAAVTVEATVAINADHEMSEQSHRWFRPNARAIAQHRDGVSVPTAGIPPLMAIAGQILPPVDAQSSGRYWLESTKKQVENCAGFGLILVEDLDNREAQIAVGRYWQQLQLTMTGLQIASQPINQIPEMIDRDRELNRPPAWAAKAAAITKRSALPTFAFRYGTPTRDVPHSARRALQDVLV